MDNQTLFTIALPVIIILIILLTMNLIYKKKKNTGFQSEIKSNFVNSDPGIKNALQDMIDKEETNNGFVIFNFPKNNLFIQYTYENKNFILSFFKSRIITEEHIEKLKMHILKNYTKTQNMGSLKKGEYLELNSGIEINVGNNVIDITKLTIKIAEKVYQIDSSKVQIQLELNN